MSRKPGWNHERQWRWTDGHWAWTMSNVSVDANQPPTHRGCQSLPLSLSLSLSPSLSSSPLLGCCLHGQRKEGFACRLHNRPTPAGQPLDPGAGRTSESIVKTVRNLARSPRKRVEKEKVSTRPLGDGHRWPDWYVRTYIRMYVTCLPWNPALGRETNAWETREEEGWKEREIAKAETSFGCVRWTKGTQLAMELVD